MDPGTCHVLSAVGQTCSGARVNCNKLAAQTFAGDYETPRSKKSNEALRNSGVRRIMSTRGRFQVYGRAFSGHTERCSRVRDTHNNQANKHHSQLKSADLMETVGLHRPRAQTRNRAECILAMSIV